MAEEKKRAEEVKTEVRAIITRLENTPLNTWDDLGEVLEKIAERVEKLAIVPPRRVRIYNVWHPRFLSGVWFRIVFQWAFWSDMITNPFRRSDFKADTEKRVITVEQF